MNNLLEIIQNKYIYMPILMWFFSQLFKVIYDFITTKKLNFKRMLGAGGMPSSHSVMVMTLATMVGKAEGVDSTIFAVIVMYDACGVRRAAGKQAEVLNKIIDTPKFTGLQMSERLIEVLGHTPIQVLVGAIIGIIVGLIV